MQISLNKIFFVKLHFLMDKIPSIIKYFSNSKDEIYS